MIRRFFAWLLGMEEWSRDQAPRNSQESRPIRLRFLHWRVRQDQAEIGRIHAAEQADHDKAVERHADSRDQERG